MPSSRMETARESAPAGAAARDREVPVEHMRPGFDDGNQGMGGQPACAYAPAISRAHARAAARSSSCGCR